MCVRVSAVAANQECQADARKPIVARSGRKKGDIMTNKKMGHGQNRQLRADFGRDKTEKQGPEEKREVARRQGSSKKAKT
jgi:hypothetical protein